MLCIDPVPCVDFDVHPVETKEYIEEEVKRDPEFHVALQAKRRRSLGLEDPRVKALLATTQCVSLGTSCSVAAALQALGLRGEAGPFDWLRISARSVGFLLRTGFQDFFDTESIPSRGEGDRVAAARSWEGSFWHHDVRDPDVQLAFHRRIDRFLNPRGRNVIFVRAVNSSEELHEISELFATLKQHFRTVRVHLAVLIDLQEAAGAFCTEDLGSDVIFLPIHQAAWLNKSQAVGRAHVREMMAQTSWAYCQGFARALHIWFGQEEAAWLSSVKQLHCQLLSFCGGNCRTESYEPTFIESSVTSFLWKVLSCA